MAKRTTRKVRNEKPTEAPDASVVTETVPVQTPGEVDQSAATAPGTFPHDCYRWNVETGEQRLFRKGETVEEGRWQDTPVKKGD